MKPITKNIFWIIISCMLIIINFSLLFANLGYSAVLCIISTLVTIIVSGISFSRMKRLIKEDIVLYNKVIQNIIGKWWFWMYFILIFIFMWSILFFLGPVFGDENIVFPKITWYGNPYYGCLLACFISTFVSTFLMYWMYDRMMKHTIE